MHTDHNGCLRSSSLGAIRKRPRNREISVEADYKEVQNRRVTRQVIQRQPRVANMRSQRPVAEHGVKREERHGN